MDKEDDLGAFWSFFWWRFFCCWEERWETWRGGVFRYDEMIICIWGGISLKHVRFTMIFSDHIPPEN